MPYFKPAKEKKAAAATNIGETVAAAVASTMTAVREHDNADNPLKRKSEKVRTARSEIK